MSAIHACILLAVPLAAVLLLLGVVADAYRPLPPRRPV